MTPAYDLTYSDTYYGEQTTTINGKGANITIADMIEAGKKASIVESKAKRIAKEIEEIVFDDLGEYI